MAITELRRFASLFHCWDTVVIYCHSHLAMAVPVLQQLYAVSHLLPEKCNSTRPSRAEHEEHLIKPCKSQGDMAMKMRFAPNYVHHLVCNTCPHPRVNPTGVRGFNLCQAVFRLVLRIMINVVAQKKAGTENRTEQR